MVKYILTNKSQVWGFDLMMAVIIFVIGIIAIYIYAINFTSESQTGLETLFSEGNLLSSLILSEGSPQDWNTGNVEIPGILTEEKINQTKLDNFYSLSQNNYEQLKDLLNTRNNFYFSISGRNFGVQPENQENLARIERFSIYNNEVIKIEFLIWN